jgi:TetR/AcrR family transcriptional repressor of bet genes
MGVGRPSNTDERRAQIVEAFLEVMARDGYAGATIAKIGKASGLTPGLVHYHFANKHEILVAAIERLAQGIEQRVDARLATAKDNPRRRLESVVEAYVALGQDADPSAVASWVVIGAEAVREPQVCALYAETVKIAFRRLRKLTTEALRADGRDLRNAGQIAAALMAMIEGAYRISVNAPGILPTGFAAPMLRRTLNSLLDAEALA